MESSANLINNLLLNLDSLKIQTENNNTTKNNNVSNNLQEQLDILKSETEKLTNKYTHTSTKTKKIPPPIKTNNHSKFQTIDDMLNELNNVTYGNKTSKYGKGKKITGTFIDPRRFSDPYKYTVLSTLDETEDGEEEDSNTPVTPKTTLPYYSRKNKEYQNLHCNTTSNNKLSVSHLVSPTYCGSLRTRSFSQPENKYSVHDFKKEKRYSFNCLQKITESENEKGSSRYSIDFIKPPRTSSFKRHYRTLSKTIVEDFSGSETDSEPNSEKLLNQNQIGEMLFYKHRSLSGLESKSSFQSDKTLVNDEENF